MAECKEKLFTEFPPVSTETWMNKVTEDLKGADFSKKLMWRTNEDLRGYLRWNGSRSQIMWLTCRFFSN